MPFLLSSPDFEHQTEIPPSYTREGENISPPLRWTGVPDGTKELALIVDDPDAPADESFVHWVVYAIAPELIGLPSGLAKHPRISDLEGLMQGVNDFGEIGWDGPEPPEGHGVHRYRFELFALDRPLQVEPKLNHKALRAAMARCDY